MATIAELLAQSGLTVEAVSTGRGVDPFIREVYKALEDGAKYAYIFTHNTPDDVLATFAGADDVESGEAFVVQCASDYDVTTLRRKVNYRSTLNVNKEGKPRAKLTLGKATLSHNIADANGNALGFRVNAAH